MDAIVTAGGIPQPGGPLFEYTRGESKALLDVAGKPMIQWVLDALDGASSIDQVVIVGLPPDTGVTCPKIAAYVPNRGGMLENLRAGAEKALELNPTVQHVLVVSSDIPAITSEMVNWAVDTSVETDADVYYNVIPRQVMESSYPTSNRSFLRLKDVEVCGGDMNVIRARKVLTNDEMWERIVASRKNVFKQVALIGYDTLFLIFLRLITLDQAAKRVSERLNLKGRPIVCPYAEIGMDIDKPHQLEILRAELAK